MINAHDKLEQILKKRSYSVSSPRQVVFEALQNMEPQSMRELLAACQPKIDRATLYRTINLFEKLGIVQRLQIGWKYKLELSNAFQEHHHHLSCRQCGQLIPLPEDDRLEKRLHELADRVGFIPEDHQVEIRGLCKTCQQKKTQA
jgi:Fur family ferric uptake transcriptional regulator